eukprot:Hpha_TRINITY_DN15951_c4_g6::TRINITY_DN15951_c4_g6_i1::g.71886::m.71886
MNLLLWRVYLAVNLSYCLYFALRSFGGSGVATEQQHCGTGCMWLRTAICILCPLTWYIFMKKQRTISRAQQEADAALKATAEKNRASRGAGAAVGGAGSEGVGVEPGGAEAAPTQPPAAAQRPAVEDIRRFARRRRPR